MKTKIVKIGNSRGIRIPKSIIDQSGIKEEVELEAGNEQIIIKSVSKNRKGWDEAFQKMAQNKDDILLDAESLQKQTVWDDEEWVW